jgi:hypothetical protein
VVLLVQLGRDPRAGPGACSVYESESAGALAGRHGHAIGKHVRDLGVRGGVAPSFLPKRNSDLTGSRGLSVDDATRREFGDEQVDRPLVRAAPLFPPAQASRQTGCRAGSCGEQQRRRGCRLGRRGRSLPGSTRWS